MLWPDVTNKLEQLQITNYLKITDYKKDILESKTYSVKNEATESELETVTESEILQKDISYLFKKPWTKLSNIHKIVKIKEYIRGLNYSSSVKSKIEKNLMKLLKSKKLKKEDFIYDEDMGRIISIHNLKNNL